MDVAGAREKESSAIPSRMKARAVFGFTETQPGRMLFSTVLSSAQPTRIILPVTTVKTADNDTASFGASPGLFARTTGVMPGALAAAPVHGLTNFAGGGVLFIKRESSYTLQLQPNDYPAIIG